MNAAVPKLNSLALQSGDTPGIGMDLVCRVMFEAQQEFLSYVNALASYNPAGGGPAPVVPTYATILNKVETYCAQSLSPLPAPWYHLVNAPKVSVPGGPASEPGRRSQHEQIGAVPCFNTHASRELMSRFRDSNHSTISGMMEGHDVTVPKHAGKPVCLTWALKGECSSTCRRASAHARYSRDTIRAIHQLLTDCGVADPQP